MDNNREEKKQVIQDKMNKGINWFEDTFLPNIFPLYFQVNTTPQESFTTDGMEVNNYVINGESNPGFTKDGVTCWLEYKCTPQQFDLINNKLNKDYNSYEKPFKEAAAKQGFNSQIQTINNLEHVTFMISL